MTTMTDLQGWPLGESLSADMLGWPLGQPVDVGTPPIPGYHAWFDAQDADTITYLSAGSTSVTRWADKSGSGYDFLQSTAAKYPRYGTRELNGHPSLEFYGDADQDYMDSPCPISFRPFTLFVVSQFDGSPSSSCLIGGTAGTTPELRLSQSGNGLFNTLSAGVAVLYSAIAVFTNSAPFIFGWRLTASTITHRLYGVTAASGADSSTFNAGALRIGTDATGGQNYDGLFGEIIRYPFALSDDEMTIVLQFLHDKWGVS